MSRDAILARVRSALGPARPDRAAEYAAIPRAYRQSGALDLDARLALFEERLHDYGVATVRCAPADIPTAIAQFLTTREMPGLLVPPGFPRDLLPPAFDFPDASALTYRQIDEAPGVITLCASAIALSGSIILEDRAPGQGARALSLIPDYHLCIVGAAQLVETVPEGIRAMDAACVRVLTTIAGPSATSDIEMTRVRGVHGPRTLEVVIRLS